MSGSYRVTKKLSSGRWSSTVRSDQRGRRDRVDRDILRENIRVGISRGLSDGEVALYAGCSDKTVLRYRQEHGIAPNYTSSRRKS